MHCIYLFLLERYAHDIFTSGRSNVPTQQKPPVASNAMHFQSTSQIYSTPSRIHRWNPVGGLLWSIFVETANLGSFSRCASSLMFDGILNAMLCLRRFSPLGSHKEILNSPCLLILLIHTKHKNKRMNSWTDPTSSLHLRRTHPLGR